MIDIFNYTDYRKYLADYYREQKAGNPKFSHRYFSLRVGYNSSGFFSDVLTGKKNLTGPVLLKLAKTLKLRKEDEEYFINLVNFNQAGTIDEKNRFYEKLIGASRVRVDVLQIDKFEYFSKWHHAAVRELLCFHPFRGDFRALGKKLVPHITPDQAKQSVRLLLELGMLKIDTEGRYLPAASMVGTGEGFLSLNVGNFQRAFMDLAREGLDRFPREARDFSTVTFSMSMAELAQAREAITALRRKLMAISDKCARPDVVFQFNSQLFPLSGSGDA
ncbi:MAG: hypothetical protein JWO30_4950 [Fibrobacteres bacterium]|nr:hypothetical protein [Fibrobacterota bacterium]